MKVPKLLFLLIPGIIFFLALLVFLLKLPKPAPIQTENTITASPTVSATPQPSSKSPIEQYVENVNALQIPDPQLTRPNFDRKISLPAEK